MTLDNRINYINIGLMLLSCASAFIMPFEVFLFAYAFMGPLHYLTEISWLHDRSYYTKGKYDYWVLVAIGIFISLEYITYKFGFWPFNTAENKEMAQGWNLGDKLLFLAFFGALIMAFVKNIYVKIACLFLIFLISNGVFMPNEDGERNDSTLLYVFSSFVPTLIHVYVFTGLFMLFGALKARSKLGVWSVIVFVVCPILLFALFRDKTFLEVSQYGMSAYGNAASSDGFFDLNQGILSRFFDMNVDYSAAKTNEEAQTLFNNGWTKNVFHTQTGILLMRFIAFAYTYHYLNWFSKTEIIRWHKVPKIRFMAVIALWIASVILYVINYSLGLRWLFFLSFTHVLLEFPLNFISFVGIFKEGVAITKNGFKIAASPVKTNTSK